MPTPSSQPPAPKDPSPPVAARTPVPLTLPVPVHTPAVLTAEPQALPTRALAEHHAQSDPPIPEAVMRSPGAPPLPSHSPPSARVGIYPAEAPAHAVASPATPPRGAGRRDPSPATPPRSAGRRGASSATPSPLSPGALGAAAALGARSLPASPAGGWAAGGATPPRPRGLVEEITLDASPERRAAPALPIARALGRGVVDPVSVALSHDGAALHVGARAGTLWLRDVGTPAEAPARARGGVPASVVVAAAALSADGAVAALVGEFGVELARAVPDHDGGGGGGEGARVELALLPTGSPLAPRLPVAAALASGGETLALALAAPGASDDGLVALLDVRAGGRGAVQTQWRARVAAGRTALAVNADAGAVVFAAPGEVAVFRAGVSAPARTWAAFGAVDVAVDAAGDRVAFADERRLAVRPAMRPGRGIDLPAYRPPWYDPLVALSADGEIVAAAMRSADVALFCADSGALLATLTGQGTPPVALALAGDGGSVLACAPESFVALWYITDEVKLRVQKRARNGLAVVGNGVAGWQVNGVERSQDVDG